MAFWSKWLAPSCESCGQKILGEVFADEDREICETCHTAIEATKKAEIEARRAEEEAARARFEERKQFGVDPRTRS